YTDDQSIPQLGEIFAIGANVPYSSIVILLYNLPDFPLDDQYEVSDSLLQFIGYSEPEEQAMVRKLVRLLNQFAEASHFEQIWTELAPHQEALMAQMEHHRPSNALIEEMERVYQQTFESYRITPSLLIWSGPGWGFQTLDGKMANFVLGPMDKNFDFSNGNQFQELAIHELGHSFINHHVLTDQNTSIIQQMDSLYIPLQAAMTSQGYGDWLSCVIEHYVRAGEIIFKDLLDDPEGKAKLMQNYVEERDFVYLPFLIEKLTEYRLTQALSYQEAVHRSLLDWQATYAPISTGDKD
ncbi:MAG: DUF4932 domain-containing protein, partial [Bacteroidota bacterium]